MYQNYLKRLLAIVLSALGIVTLSWLFLLLCIAIKLDSPGPVLFKQKRVGLNKSHFNILKFRTMRIDTPKDMPTHLLANPESTSRESASSCARPPWMSCPSCSTSWWATWRWWVPVRPFGISSI